MYDCQILINIVSSDPSLELALSAVRPPERFSCEFHTLDRLTPQAMKCGILIFDIAAGGIEQLPDGLEKNTRLIICAEAGRQREIQEQAAAFCDDFWTKPLASGFIKTRLGRILEQMKTEMELWLNRNYLDTAIDSIPDLVWFKDTRGVHLKVNNAFCAAVGKTKDDVRGRGHYYIWDLEPEDYEDGEYVCLETEEEVLRRKETCLFDEKVMSKNGLRQFKTYKSPIFGKDGQVLGTVGIAHDVTDLENMITELEIVLGSMPFAILIKSNEGNIINVNEKFCEYFDKPPETIIGMNYERWKERELRNLRVFNNEGFAEAVSQKDQEPRILQIHEKTIHDIFSDSVGQLCIFRDVTSERAMEQQIIHNANTDFMTGLNNRRYFYEFMNKYRADQRVSLIYADLDSFKQINDTYGHQAGDEALILTAHLMKECFPDAFITRLGGDEFLITILGACQLDKLKARALLFQEKMRQAFSASEQLKGLSASIGIAQTDDPSIDIDMVVHQSDIALYHAKQQGKSGCCIFSEEIES